MKSITKKLSLITISTFITYSSFAQIWNEDSIKIWNNSPSKNVGIGTSNPTEKLTVNGNIKAKKVTVTQNGWADYVFDKDYKLMNLNDLFQYIQQHKHLPEIPSTAQIEKEGVDVGNNQALLLKKVEELTLYIIEQHKIMNEQRKQIIEQNKQILEQQKQIIGQNERIKKLEILTASTSR